MSTQLIVATSFTSIHLDTNIVEPMQPLQRSILRILLKDLMVMSLLFLTNPNIIPYCISPYLISLNHSKGSVKCYSSGQSGHLYLTRDFYIGCSYLFYWWFW
ncbi:unnamed protein product [Linum trigynum]|uniref:Uncharacterized protein n=1 Tax=Linum trigynum TaxID=586398 RepID=A0AAV2DUJ1_9ROSI